jgi:ABC-type microcin C transport system duplicated ATPase subunit YejF
MCVALLEQPSSGEIWFDGHNVFPRNPKERAQIRPRIQLIFQDSAAALPPHFTAAEIVEEPLAIQRRFLSRERRELVAELLEKVGLPLRSRNQFPHEFSGGQRQRLAIARSLALKPDLLLLDEPFTGLDLSIRGQIVNLLLQLQADYSLTYLYVSHDLELAACFSDTIALMDRGRIIAQAAPSEMLMDSEYALLRGFPASNYSSSTGRGAPRG